MSFQTDLDALSTTLLNGGIAVVRTDTIYGIIALASNEQAVEKVFTAKKRDTSKQCIILVDQVDQAAPYAQKINDFSGNATLPTSVVVPVVDEAAWLHRGGSTIAYRVTKDPLLKAVINKVGPVIAPSANPEGLEPATNSAEARAYFGDTVDLYIDGGQVPDDVAASEILKINEDETVEVLRSQFEHEISNNKLVLKKHHSAGGLIFNNTKVLLIHWDPPRDTYDFPKGHLDEGESSEAAAVREVYEETGYKTKIINHIDTHGFYYQNSKGKWGYKTVDYYLLESVDGIEYPAVREPHETFENVWVSIDDAPNIITRPINVEIFNKALLLRNKHNNDIL